MTHTYRLVQQARQGTTMLVALVLMGCAGQQQGQVPGLLGYGTPDVSAYVPVDQATNLQAMRARCEGVPPAAPAATQGLPAACDQLRRTQGNQPGNAARPTVRPM